MNESSLLAKNSDLAKQWHPTKNGDLTPNDVQPWSREKVWWKCPEGDDHEWQNTVSKRTSGQGCPVCLNQKVVKSNCLATLNPGLAREWHPTKNGDFSPENVSSASNKMIWWKCPKGDDHEWRASVNTRQRGHGCGVCANRVVVNSNCLETLNPELTKEWHPTKNGMLTPGDVTPGSHKKVWWKCNVGDDHEWEAPIKRRSNGSQCAVCSNRKIVKSNSLSTLNPEIAKEWHPTKNGKLTPCNVSNESNKSVWWKCSKGEDHVWKTKIAKRKQGTGCPVCLNQIVVRSNCLATVRPDLTKEWHPIKNGKLTPRDVVPGAGKKVWWKCPKGKEHEWKTTLDERNRGSGCPFCFGSTSAPELRIYAELKHIFPSILNRVKLNGYEVDIFIPELNFGIEYDGVYWHRNKVEKDLEKSKALEKEIFLLRVREKGLKKILNTDIKLNSTDVTLETIKIILKFILNMRDLNEELSHKINKYLEIDSWCADKIFKKLLTNKNTLSFESSIKFLYPDLVPEWDYERNEPLVPEHFSPGSNQKVWWKGKCGHDWEQAIYNRVKGQGCPKCRGKKANRTKRKRRFNTLQLELEVD